MDPVRSNNSNNADISSEEGATGWRSNLPWLQVVNPEAEKLETLNVTSAGAGAANDPSLDRTFTFLGAPPFELKISDYHQYESSASVKHSAIPNRDHLLQILAGVYQHNIKHQLKYQFETDLANKAHVMVSNMTKFELDGFDEFLKKLEQKFQEMNFFQRLKHKKKIAVLEKYRRLYSFFDPVIMQIVALDTKKEQEEKELEKKKLKAMQAQAEAQKNYFPLHDCLRNKQLSDEEQIRQINLLHSEWNKPDRDGNTPLHIAVKECSTKVSEHLLTKISDVNMKNHQGDTPLHLAVQHASIRCIEALQTKGASYEIQNHKGYTPLHMMARASDIQATDCMRHLIESGYSVDLNMQDRHGRTILHHAVLTNKLDLVRLLLNCNQIEKREDCDGLSPFDLEIECNHNSQGIANIFAEAGWRVNLKKVHSMLVDKVDGLFAAICGDDISIHSEQLDVESLPFITCDYKSCEAKLDDEHSLRKYRLAWSSGLEESVQAEYQAHLKMNGPDSVKLLRMENNLYLKIKCPQGKRVTECQKNEFRTEPQVLLSNLYEKLLEDEIIPRKFNLENIYYSQEQDVFYMHQFNNVKGYNIEYSKKELKEKYESCLSKFQSEQTIRFS